MQFQWPCPRDADDLAARAPPWRRVDFMQAALNLSERLQAEKRQSAALWFDDAARFACAFLACAHAGVDVYLPPNRAAENARWADDAADVWLSDGAVGAVRKAQITMTDADENTLSGSLKADDIVVQAGTTVYLKTSGSSGQAQVVRKTLAQLRVEVQALADTLCLPAQVDAVIGSVSPQHLYGLTFRIVLALCAGWPMWRSSCVYPESLLEATAANRRCVWVLSPTLLNALSAHGLPEALAARVALAFSAGGALPEATAAALAQRLPQPLQEIYGSTETGIIATRAHPQRWCFFDPLVHEIGAHDTLRVCAPWSNGWQQTADAVRCHGDGFDLLGRLDSIIKLADKRVSLTRIEHDLLQHAWVADAHCALHPQHTRVAAWVALSSAGVAAWRAQGRLAVVAALKKRLALSQDAVAQPRYWRFDTALPRNAQGKLAAADFAAALAQRPRAPQWRLSAEGAQEWRFQGRVPLDLRYFSGHFDAFPLVPGVVELQWVLDLARQHIRLPEHVLRVENLKYQQFLRPADRARLWLVWQPEKQKLQFTLENDTGVCASGRVVLAARRESLP